MNNNKVYAYLYYYFHELWILLNINRQTVLRKKGTTSIINQKLYPVNPRVVIPIKSSSFEDRRECM